MESTSRNSCSSAAVKNSSNKIRKKQITPTSDVSLKIKFLKKLKLKEKAEQPLVLLQRLEQYLAAPYIKELQSNGALKVIRTSCRPKPKRKKIEVFKIVSSKFYNERKNFIMTNKPTITERNSAKSNDTTGTKLKTVKSITAKSTPNLPRNIKNAVTVSNTKTIENKDADNKPNSNITPDTTITSNSTENRANKNKCTNVGQITKSKNDTVNSKEISKSTINITSATPSINTKNISKSNTSSSNNTTCTNTKQTNNSTSSGTNTKKINGTTCSTSTKQIKSNIGIDNTITNTDQDSKGNTNSDTTVSSSIINDTNIKPIDSNCVTTIKASCIEIANISSTNEMNDPSNIINSINDNNNNNNNENVSDVIITDENTTITCNSNDDNNISKNIKNKKNTNNNTNDKQNICSTICKSTTSSSNDEVADNNIDTPDNEYSNIQNEDVVTEDCVTNEEKNDSIDSNSEIEMMPCLSDCENTMSPSALFVNEDCTSDPTSVRPIITGIVSLNNISDLSDEIMHSPCTPEDPTVVEQDTSAITESESDQKSDLDLKPKVSNSDDVSDFICKQKIEDTRGDTGIPKIILYLKGKGPDKQYMCASNVDTNKIQIKKVNSDVTSKKSVKVMKNKSRKDTDKSTKHKISNESDFNKSTGKKGKNMLKEQSCSPEPVDLNESGNIDVYKKIETISNIIKNGDSQDSDQSFSDSLPDLELMPDTNTTYAMPPLLPQGMKPIDDKTNVSANFLSEDNDDLDTNKTSKVSLTYKHLGKPTAHVEPYVAESAFRSSARKGKGFYDESVPFLLDQEDMVAIEREEIEIPTETNLKKNPNTQDTEIWQQSINSSENDLKHHCKSICGLNDKKDMTELSYYQVVSKLDVCLCSPLSCAKDIKMKTSKCPIHDPFTNLRQQYNYDETNGKLKQMKILNKNEKCKNCQSNHSCEYHSQKTRKNLDEEVDYLSLNIYNYAVKHEISSEEKFDLKSGKYLSNRPTIKSESQNFHSRPRPRSLSIDSALSLFKVRVENSALMFPLRKSLSLINFKNGNNFPIAKFRRESSEQNDFTSSGSFQSEAEISSEESEMHIAENKDSEENIMDKDCKIKDSLEFNKKSSYEFNTSATKTDNAAAWGTEAEHPKTNIRKGWRKRRESKRSKYKKYNKKRSNSLTDKLINEEETESLERKSHKSPRLGHNEEGAGI